MQSQDGDFKIVAVASSRSAEQRRAEPTALPASVDRQPSEQGDDYRIRHIAASASGRRLVQY